MFTELKIVQAFVDNCEPDKKELISDGYHSFKQLYEFRKVYNACLFNEWANQNKYDAHKTRRLYSDNQENVHEMMDGWFIVFAILPTGQISNYYEMKDWDLFQIPEVEKAKYPFDGHSHEDVLQRLSCL